MIDRDSRYGTCVLIRDGRGEALGSRRPIAAPRRHDDRFHTVIAGDRIDLLAWRYLGDSRRWWTSPTITASSSPSNSNPALLCAFHR